MNPYLIYALSSLALTLGLAATLRHEGGAFLRDMLPATPKLGRAINNLLTTGFFMLNLGYAFLTPNFNDETLAQDVLGSLGRLLVVLAVIHFINIGVIWRIRASFKRKEEVPVAAQYLVSPPPVAAPATGQ